ncbi:MAG: hypothetical protein JNM95_14280 [Chitinophagaceae bacterium]|nr:hypothetical protein [Chitinophagaceae bacterium]
MKSAQIEKHIWEFGAKGDGIQNDHLAFMNACRWFHNPLNFGPGDIGILYIDYFQYDALNNIYTTTPAEYKVGVQIGFNESYPGYDEINLENYTNPTPSGDRYLKLGIPVMEFHNLKNLTIKTYYPPNNDPSKKAKIKYADGLYFGAFLPPNYNFVYYVSSCTAGSCSGGWNPTIEYNNETNYPPNGCTFCPASNTEDCYCADPGFAYSISITAAGNETNTTSDIKKFAPGWHSGLTNYDDIKTLCTVGYVFNLVDCENVLIENLELDGNNVNSIWGSRKGDSGIQLPYTGVSVYGSNINKILNNNFTNLEVHHFGLDGFYVQGDANTVNINDCFSEYNSRDGISWVGGKNLTVNNSHFNYTGQATSAADNTILLKSSPGDGIDIEADNPHQVRIGKFNHCNFKDNYSFALESNYYEASNYYAEDIKFTDCTFIDIKDIGIQIIAPNVIFDDCNFFCRFKGGYYGTDASKKTQFINHCVFSDLPYNGIHFNTLDYLVSIPSGNSTIFDECTFSVNDIGREPMEIYTEPYTNRPVSEWPTFSNSTFLYNVSGNGSVSRFNKVKFKQNNLFKTNATQPCNGRTIYFSDILVEGSDNFCEPNVLNFDGQINVQLGDPNYHTPPLLDEIYIGKKNNLTDDGYAIVKCKNSAILHGFNEFSGLPSITHSLIIGSKAKVDIIESSGLEAVDTKCYGSLLLHQNAFIHQNRLGLICLPPAAAPCNVNTLPSSKVFISSLCNPGIIGNMVALPPVYTTGIGCSIISTPNNAMSCMWDPEIIGGACVSGQNSAFASISCSPDNYSLISTSNTFDVVYKPHDLTCFGANNGSLEFMVYNNLGVNPPLYEYSFDEINWQSAPNVISNLSQGIYTIYLRDIQNCLSSVNSFSFEINSPSIITWNISSVTNNLCFGGSLGSISATATGGTGAISITVSPGGSLSNLTANTYTLTATDANGCTATTSVTISQPSALVFSSVTSTNVSCNGGNNGSISATATGGTGAISITVAPGGSLTNLTANTYTLTATDANSCTATTSVTISQPSALVFSSVTSTNVSCNGGNNGSISATATGGTGAISITVAPGGNLTNLTPNTYTLTATDANSCTVTTTVTITQPSTAIHWTYSGFNNQPCNSTSGGSLNVTAQQ